MRRFSYGKRTYGGSRFGQRRAGFSSASQPQSRKLQGFNFSESMFIKKPSPITEEITYTPKFRFGELDVHPTLKRNIVMKKFDVPTPIQDQTIEHIINGKDLLGIADTGTGKTAAFLIPLIDKVLRNRGSNILIITPTRELALQINEELYTLTRDLRVFSVPCIGGASINNQIYNLRRGYNFIVGTPGRLKDLSDRRVIDLPRFDTIVLDEVDRMLDMGFVHEIKHLISFLPETRQSLCFSATIHRKVESIIDILLKKDYVKISIKTGETAKNVEQDIIRVERREDKIAKLEILLKTEGFEKVLVFANTKRQVDKLDKHFSTIGHKVEAIHGGKRQNERKKALERFKMGASNILIATDVAARGLDIQNISHVINFDIPMNYEDYIHRVGRTGRVNKKGIALTFVEGDRYRY